MSTKTISIRDDTYDLLKNVKREGESFSDVIDRLIKKERTDLSAYFGSLVMRLFWKGWRKTPGK